MAVQFPLNFQQPAALSASQLGLGSFGTPGLSSTITPPQLFPQAPALSPSAFQVFTPPQPQLNPQAGAAQNSAQALFGNFMSMMSLMLQSMGGQPSPFGLPQQTGIGGIQPFVPFNFFGGAQPPNSPLGFAQAPFPQALPQALPQASVQSAGGAGNPLRASLDRIAQDPDGAKLIAAAHAKGVYIEVGDPSTANGNFDMVSQCNCPACQGQRAADGTVTVNGVTLTNSSGQSKIVVRDPSNIKTIVHELVHAVSTGDGNSRDEEGIADVVGSRVANRLGAPGGLAGSEQQIFINKQQFYPELMQSNGIRQTLFGLGIGVSV